MEGLFNKKTKGMPPAPNHLDWHFMTGTRTSRSDIDRAARTGQTECEGFGNLQAHLRSYTARSINGQEVQTFSSGCSERLKVFPSGSLNQATFAPVGEVQMPSSS
jgi:hypothetical protein